VSSSLDKSESSFLTDKTGKTEKAGCVTGHKPTKPSPTRQGMNGAAPRTLLHLFLERINAGDPDSEIEMSSDQLSTHH
jgi:hypothetical protein